MSAEPQLFRINHKSKDSERIAETDFSNLGLYERWDIQEWIADNPGILGEDLLIITKEFSDFDRTRERLDLLAVDTDGKLVVIELKRDDSGSDVHWQAIKYASYLRQANQYEVIHMLAAHEKMSEQEAEQKLREHIDSGNLDILNNDQRIILASHRFAPEATSAVLWLNEKAQNENLITCVQLTPYPDDAKTDSIYLQVNTIIPVPGTESYSIRVGNSQEEGSSIRRRTTVSSRRNDEATQFVRKVESLALDGLAEELKPDSNYGWAKGGDIERWYCIWYLNRPPWEATKFNYVIHVNGTSEGFGLAVNFETRKRFLRGALGYSELDIKNFKRLLESLFEFGEVQDNRTFLRPRVSFTVKELDDSAVVQTADTLRRMIEAVTTPVEQFEDERSNQEAAP